MPNLATISASTWWGLLIAALLLSVLVMFWVRRKKIKNQMQARATRMRRKRRRTAALPPKATATAASSSNGPPSDTPERRPVILVVDDSKSALVHAQRILETRAYRVVVAENGHQAWGLLQDQKPDLVISDIDMPKLDGFGLLRLIREDLRLADLPVMLMTGHLYLHVQAHQHEGFDSLLPKPYRPEDLLDQVKFLLQE